jgi:hypothetical protein
MTTGYNIREGSEILAQRRDTLRVVTDHDVDVAEAMLRNARARQLSRRARISGLARLAQAILSTPAVPVESRRKPW